MIDTRVVSTSLQNVEMKNEANQDLAQDEKAIFKSNYHTFGGSYDLIAIVLNAVFKPWVSQPNITDNSRN